MHSRKANIIVTIIISIAIFGAIYKMLREPKDFIFTILLTLGIVFTILILFSFIRSRRNPSHHDEIDKYNAALKQSQLKYGKQQTRHSPKRKHKRRRKASHLTVIEGGKNNRN